MEIRNPAIPLHLEEQIEELAAAYLPALPDPEVVAGQAAVQITTANTWQPIPGPFALTMTFEKDCWVQYSLACWMVIVATGDLRSGVRVEGSNGTVFGPLDPHERVVDGPTHWGSVNIIRNLGTIHQESTKTIMLPAGTYTFTAVAYRNTTVDSYTNYPVLTVNPQRWA